MRQSQAFIPTLREISEAEVISHQLLLRAGFIRQTAAGVYTYLPLAKRVLNKVEEIVRQEMDRIGSQELLLPILSPADLWRMSGRYHNYGPLLMTVHDRHEREFVLGPTHEEMMTDVLRDEVNSYKKLPIVLYQIQTKFRDEKRPRSGLLRGREFVMKDAYSFHLTRESLDETYEDMFQAYMNIFSRIGLHFRAVEADSGAMGGKGTHEFMALADSGEDTIVLCSDCNYAANLEMAEVSDSNRSNNEVLEPLQPAMEKVATPGQKSILEVSSFLGVSEKETVKSLLFMLDGQPVLAMVRGDHEVNETKVKNALGGTVCELASPREIQKWTGTVAGYIGPVGLDKEVTIIADQALKSLPEWIVGANEQDQHYVHLVPDRDIQIERYADIRLVQEGDSCPHCGQTLTFRRGIELGHIFKLGTRYSKSMRATVLDQDGCAQPMLMGCYGIGISRVLSTIIEQKHDERGICWPKTIAPYTIHLIVVNPKQEAQQKAGEQIYQQLLDQGYEVLYDDRFERAGVKFADADLIGIPLRITVGKRVQDGLVEIKLRHNGENEDLPLTDILQEVPKWLLKVE